MVGMLVGVWSVWWSVCGRYGGRYGGRCVVGMVVGGEQHDWQPCQDKRQAELEVIAVTAEI